jgi:choline dehydrogenase-like flavoprotein
MALRALKYESSVKLQSSPTAAFLLWQPKMLGAARADSFGLGQLSFSLKLSNDITAFGSTFSTLGLPMSEFIRHMPLSKRYSADLLRQLLSSCLVGNLFLPGNLSTTEVTVNADGEMNIFGGYCSSVSGLMTDAACRLRKSYWKVGALLMPMSFTQGLPGGDIHSSSTLPMQHNPSLGQTDANGELAGLAGVHVVDGACLSALTEKSHTLTIMANADRIGKMLAKQRKEIN